MKEFLTERRRAYLYRVLAAVGVVALGYGLITEDELVRWLGLAAVSLNVLPIANTSTKSTNP